MEQKMSRQGIIFSQYVKSRKNPKEVKTNRRQNTQR